MLSDTALKNIHELIANCDELINGRYIFAENIIEKILLNISKTPEVYDLISDCMQNFNFEREFNRAKVKLPTKDGYFVMPESKAIVLPLVFCILVDIRDKKINFHEFVKDYFTSEDLNEFENFAQTLIVPFKNAIAYCFDIEQKPQQTVVVDQQEVEPENSQENEQEIAENNRAENKLLQEEKLKNFMSKAKIICEQMQSEILSDPKVKPDLKNDAIYLLNIMIECTQFGDIKHFSAYTVAIDYIARPIKSLRFLAQELRQILADFYS